MNQGMMNAVPDRFGIGGETYVAIFVALDLLFVAFAIWRYRRSTSIAVAPREITAERAAV